MHWTLALGSLLAALCAVTSLPQLRRTLRTRNVAALSPATQLAWCASWIGWCYYSLSIGAYPKLAAEIVGLSCDLALL